MRKLILRVLVLTLLWQISPASAADTPDNAAKISRSLLDGLGIFSIQMV
jgi:hypothetical protein